MASVCNCGTSDDTHLFSNTILLLLSDVAIIGIGPDNLDFAIVSLAKGESWLLYFFSL